MMWDVGERFSPVLLFSVTDGPWAVVVQAAAVVGGAETERRTGKVKTAQAGSGLEHPSSASRSLVTDGQALVEWRRVYKFQHSNFCFIHYSIRTYGVRSRNALVSKPGLLVGNLTGHPFQSQISIPRVRLMWSVAVAMGTPTPVRSI